MKIYFMLILTLLLLVQACKKENVNEPPIQADEDYWEFKSQPDKYIRSLKMCSNGFMFAEAPWMILKSTDKGETWETSLAHITEGAIGIGPNDEIYVAGGSKILFSYDYGNTWNSRDIKIVDSVLIEVGVIIFCITTDMEGTVYIGTGSGVFRSDDRGNSWTRLIDGMLNQEIRSLLINSDNKVFAGSYSSGVYISTNKGENWQVGSTDDQTIFALSEDSLGNLYAGGINKLFLSNDNGKSWQIISSFDNVYFTDMFLDKNNIIYASLADVGILVSKDIGTTWEEKNKGLKKTYGVRSLVLDKDGFIFAGTDGFGIYKSKKSIY